MVINKWSLLLLLQMVIILTVPVMYCVPQKIPPTNATFSELPHKKIIRFTYLSDLRLRDEYCNFRAVKESLIRDQIVVGINDPTLQSDYYKRQI